MVTGARMLIFSTAERPHYYWRQIGRLELIEDQWAEKLWPQSLALVLERDSLVRELKVLAPAEYERRLEYAVKAWLR